MATSNFPKGYRLIGGNYFKDGDRSGPYAINSAGVPSLVSTGTGGGGGGGGGDVPVPSAQTIIAPATVPITTAAQVAPANASRTRIIFRNTGTSDVALGPAGVTPASAAIYLKPGALWIETDLPRAAWFAVAEGAPSTLAIHTLIL